MNYNEDEILTEAYDYIKNTYGEHYAGKKEVQLFDYWHSIGILTPVAIGTAIKYLGRYGKKDGKNKKDLLKAIHYTVLAMYSEFYADEVETVDPDTDERESPDNPLSGLIDSDTDQPLSATLAEIMQRLGQAMQERRDDADSQ